MKVKSILSVLLAGVFCLLFSSCNLLGAGNGNSNSSSIAPHVHMLEKTEEKQATCYSVGNKEYYYCKGCSTYFLDGSATQKTTWKDLVIAKLAHPNMQYKQSITPTATTDGQAEHWYCPDCDRYYLDEEALVLINKADVIVKAGTWEADFTVEIPAGRDPVVLQLTDTQIIDGAQSRPEQSAGDKITYATEKIPQFCYNYVEETIEATNPDLIIITGDLVYGKYDDNGSALQGFIAFMESFEIPWAPVFGNHDNESAMGADWQCQQLENAEYCLFEQRALTGNGNYTVGIKQGGRLTRVFVMLDSGGCGAASSASLANGQTKTSVGFGGDQVTWYTQELTALKAYHPDTKISFAFHIQLAVFGDAMAQHGYRSDKQDIWVKSEGDFGYIGAAPKSPWDKDYKIFNGMKLLGADSIFVGHEHCNSASMVYQGVRLQYGQKSSEYDRFNGVTAANEVHKTYLYKSDKGTPLIGGTVIKLSQTDGSIADAYIYYCENAGGNLDWSKIY